MSRAIRASGSSDRQSNMNSPQHSGEDRSNALRQRLLAVEPATQRTYTPSLAMLAHSAGAYHWTADGRKLADFTSGVLVANLGHNPSGWWRRVLSYLGLDALPDGGEFASAAPQSAYNAATPLEILASERLIHCLQRQPGGARCQQVLWAASGSEAVQKALWAAQARRAGSDVILATRRGFHGKKGLAGAITGDESDPDRDPRVRFIPFPMEECGSVARRRQPIDLAPYAAALDGLWEEYGQRICAVCTEPYLGGGGSFHPQPEYVQLLEQFCRRRDLVFILDEIQSNFGRTGNLFAFTTYGVEPDIVVLGKGMGNGVPVDAAVGRADLFGSLPYGAGSDTWSAHPLGCAAVLATLDEFQSGKVMEQAHALSAVLETGLDKLCKLPIVAAVRGEGVVWGVECQAFAGHTASDVAGACVLACYLGDNAGRAIHLLGPLAGKVLRISPPLVMPAKEAEEYLQAMYAILAGVVERLQAAATQ